MENELIKTLAEAIDSQAKKAKSTAYDTTAEVRRVEGDTVWVHIPGGVDETPVRKTISCSPGDSVQVRIANGRGFLVGNGTSPPTDDTVAYIAQETANVAVEDAARARTAADSAEASAIEAKSAANQAVSDAATAGRAASVAQTAAEAALETANTKKTVFVNEPTPPYHVGDLWVYNEVETDNLQTSDGDDLIIALGDIIEAVILGSTTVYVCTNARLTGSFDENDWKPAATDDSAVNELREWFWHDANGAHVLGDVSGYRNDISSTGMKIMDTATETSIAEFGTSISFADDRTVTIGNNNTYIIFDPSDGGSITIGGGSRVNIGSGKTLNEVLTDIDVSVTQTSGGADITINGDTVSLSDGYSPTATVTKSGDTATITITDKDGTTTQTVTDGTNGTSVTVTSVAYAYQLSTSGTTIPTGTWQTTPQAPTTTQYAWTRTTTTYSDNSTAVTYTVGGKTGTNGTSPTVSSSTTQYQKSTSGTSVPTGTWSNSALAPDENNYVWTKTTITYSDNSTATVYAVAGKQGTQGAQGDTGPEGVVTVSISSVNWKAGTATLAATLRVNGTITAPSSYKWTKGTSTTSLGTSSTLSITDLDAVYNCTVTW